MRVVEMDGPGPEGGGGVENKSALVFGDYFSLTDTRHVPTQGDTGGLKGKLLFLKLVEYLASIGIGSLNSDL